MDTMEMLNDRILGGLDVSKVSLIYGHRLVTVGIQEIRTLISEVLISKNLHNIATRKSSRD